MFEQMIESELDEEQELPSVDGPGLDFPDAPAASKSSPSSFFGIEW